MAVKFPTKAQLEKMQKTNKEIKNRGGNVKVVPKVNKKINEKANKIETSKSESAKSGVQARWEAAARQHENRARQEFGISKKPTVKINSNPVPGKTIVSSMARGAGQGGLAGLALSAVAAYKQQLADLAKRKREIS